MCQATMLGSEDEDVNQIDTVPVLLSNRKSDFKQSITVMKGFAKEL